MSLSLDPVERRYELVKLAIAAGASGEGIPVIAEAIRKYIEGNVSNETN